MNMQNIEIEYCFDLEGDQSDSYKVILDPIRLQTIEEVSKALPEWTRLGFHQCENCPLERSAAERCPAAVNMVLLVERFNQLLSYDTTTVTVITAERTVYHQTTVQRAVCSLMGLLMASSGCPRTAFFKPMARFHLPFASTEETIWRATSTYLLAQYFQQTEGETPDICFNGLRDIYDQIQIVNQAFAKRLRSACRHDSMINAIILLDMFAKSMPTAIEASLDDIRHLFEPYLMSLSSI